MKKEIKTEYQNLSRSLTKAVCDLKKLSILIKHHKENKQNNLKNPVSYPTKEELVQLIKLAIIIKTNVIGVEKEIVRSRLFSSS